MWRPLCSAVSRDIYSTTVIAGLLGVLIFAAPSAFAKLQHQAKIDRGLAVSLRNGAPTQNVIIAVKTEIHVWGTTVLKGKPY